MPGYRVFAIEANRWWWYLTFWKEHSHKQVSLH